VRRRTDGAGGFFLSSTAFSSFGPLNASPPHAIAYVTLAEGQTIDLSTGLA